MIGLPWGALVLALAIAPPEKDPHPRLDDIADHFTFEGVRVNGVGWGPCGSLNAFYDPTTQSIRMCEELVTIDPGVVRFFFAHELAHAVIVQRGIPYVGSEEVAADELAGYVLVLSGNAADLHAASEYFANKYAEGWRVPPWDAHPDNLNRAITLECLSLGRLSNKEPACYRSWDRVLWTWTTLLAE